ncbi:Uncharacterized protein PECH_003357 [Penicillium ucsense]|uniref:Uncharacterized protein n=1 Tax=Penicillium ucsense TaxID=2839758 RepID=A0A8J8WKX1_9EURO|nr:Uncharacterized protein PECM_000167 [Penicillium ucsense]KAF7739382.1 Uncharacterized protein PECH_003357 [Penicillium ucsense]
METVNKVVEAASAAIWGTDNNSTEQQTTAHGEEPVSGVQGTGSASDPYDAGNRDEQPDAPISDENTASQEPRLDGAQSDPLRKDLAMRSKPETVVPTTTTPSTGLAAPLQMGSTALSPVPVDGAAVGSATTSSNPASETPATSSAEFSPVPVDGAPMTSTSKNSAKDPALGSESKKTTSDASPAASVERAPLTSVPSSSSQGPRGETIPGDTVEPTKTEKTEQRVSESAKTTSEGQGESSKPTKTIGHQDVSEEALKGPQGPAPVSEENFVKEAENTSATQNKLGTDDKAAQNATDSADKMKHDSSSDHGKQGALHKIKEKLHKVAHPHSSSH